MIDMINVKVKSITIVTTHRCTASCDDCCFDCSPFKRDQLTYQQIKWIINECIKLFPSIRLIVFSGGECFLLGSDLDRSIRYAKNKGLKTRVVTNAYWASEINKTIKRLSRLKDVGLDEINISTGDNHLKFVDKKNVLNVVGAAINLKFSPLAITIEGHPDSKFKVEDFLNLTGKSIGDFKSVGIEILTSSWMKFTCDGEKTIENYKLNVLNEKPCSSLFDNRTINPDMQLLACCGLTVECNKYLKLGDLKFNKLYDFYNEQFNNLYLLLLYTHGPEYLYRRVCEVKEIVAKKYPHPCAYCIEVVSGDNIDVLKKILIQDYYKMLVRLKLINERIMNI